MEKKIQELKDLFKGDAEMFIVKNIERFYEILSDISNEYLVKTKERELELKDEVKSLDTRKEEVSKWLEDNSKTLLEHKDKIEALDKYKQEIAKREQVLEEKEKVWDTNNHIVLKEMDKLQKDKDAFEKEKQQFQVQKMMVEEQVKTLRKLNI